MLGIAILGSGAIASVHADAYLCFKDRCEIRGICDLFPEKAAALIEKKGLKNAQAHKDIEELFARPDIDAVSICLPPDVHAGIAVKALRAGKHVLVEKPMASSLDECDEMIRASEESGKILAPVAQNRFKTPAMTIPNAKTWESPSWNTRACWRR
jgi:predicted dehydrogenase